MTSQKRSYTQPAKRPVADEDIYKQIDRCIDCGGRIVSTLRPGRKRRFFRCCGCTAVLFAMDPKAGTRH